MFSYNLSVSRKFLPLIFSPIIVSVGILLSSIILAYYQQWWAVSLVFIAPGLLKVLRQESIELKNFLYSILFIIGFLRTDSCLQYQHALLPIWHCSIEATVENIAFVQSKTWRYQSLLKVHRYFNNRWHNKPFTLQLYTHKKPDFKVADTIHCALDHIPKPEGPFHLYLLKEGIDATAFQPIVISKVINRPYFSLKRWLEYKRRSLDYVFAQKMKPPVFALFSSLFMGNKNSAKQELEDQKPLFKLWGISHFLARSGFHLLIFIALLTALLRLIPLHFLIKQILIIGITLIYFMFSWSSISFYRAFYTSMCIKAATLFDTPLHSMHTLGLICFLTLLKNPLYFFFLDFQLTFLLTFALIWITQTHHQRKMLYMQSIA